MKLIESERYLPSFMRDFHDQKDIFKSISWWGQNSKANIEWIKAHCYVIDIFLKFMALHGYTLQKSRTIEEAHSIEDTIKHVKDIETGSFNTILKERNK